MKNTLKAARALAVDFALWILFLVGLALAWAWRKA